MQHLALSITGSDRPEPGWSPGLSLRGIADALWTRHLRAEPPPGPDGLPGNTRRHQCDIARLERLLRPLSRIRRGPGFEIAFDLAGTIQAGAGHPPGADLGPVIGLGLR